MHDLKVCIGSACHIKGSYNVIQVFQQLIEENKLHDAIEIGGIFCMKQCQHGVAVSLDGEIFNVTPENAYQFFQETILPKVSA